MGSSRIVCSLRVCFELFCKVVIGVCVCMYVFFDSSVQFNSLNVDQTSEDIHSFTDATVLFRTFRTFFVHFKTGGYT